MDEEELRRALRATPPERDGVSAPVRAAMQSARRQQDLLRWVATLAIALVTGAVLWFGYDLASAVLPRIGEGGGALLWIPLGVAAAIVIAAALAALAAIGRRH